MSQTLDILDRLIGFDTVSARSNIALIDFVQNFLSQRGFRVARFSDPDEPKAGLFAEIGPEADRGVVLSAHSDVVPVEGQTWTRPPFALSREGDRLFGRGTTDMKGFVASMLSAADQASGLSLNEPFKLVLSYDEEVGCTGIARMMPWLEPRLGRPRAAIVGEPTNLQVATGHKGKRGYLATITGEAGHSALAPRFVNAVNVATDFVSALAGLQQDLVETGARDEAYDIPYSTVHVGKLYGGRALNIVPDHAEVSLEFRHLAQDDPDALQKRIESVADQVSRRYGTDPRIALEPLASYPGLETSPDAKVVAGVEALARNGRTKVAFGTEAGFFDALGIPTVVCGPGNMEGQGHKADEFIELSELVACDRMLERLLLGMAH